MTQSTTQPRDYIGKQFLSYKVWYNQAADGKTQTKTFDNLREAEAWVTDNEPYYWRVDMLIQVIVDAAPEPISPVAQWVEEVEAAEEEADTEDDGYKYNLNEAQKAAMVDALDNLVEEVISGPTAAALRRRGLVNPGHHSKPRALTKLGKEVAKRLKANS